MCVGTYAVAVREKRAIRRLDVFPFFLASIPIVGLGFGVPYNWSRMPTAAAIGWLGVAAEAGVFCYLCGPAARFVVTRTQVIVENTFVRYVVPRHAVGHVEIVETFDSFEVYLNVNDGRQISVRAVWPAMVRPTRNRLPRLRRNVEQLSRLLTEVPAAPTIGTVERQLRYGNLFLALAALAGFVTFAVYIFALKAALAG